MYLSIWSFPVSRPLPASSSMCVCPASPFPDRRRQNQARPLRAHLKLLTCGGAGGKPGLSPHAPASEAAVGSLRMLLAFTPFFKLCPPGLSTLDIFFKWKMAVTYLCVNFVTHVLFFCRSHKVFSKVAKPTAAGCTCVCGSTLAARWHTSSHVILLEWPAHGLFTKPHPVWPAPR